MRETTIKESMIRRGSVPYAPLLLTALRQLVQALSFPKLTTCLDSCRYYSFRIASLAIAAGIAVTVAAGNLSADPVTYGLNNVRYFPSGGGTVTDLKPGTLTPATADSHLTSFSTNPGDPTANTFDGLDTINGSPFQMGVSNSVTINTATTSSLFNWLSFAVAFVNETGVTVTGGSGTGYLLPTFRFTGSFNDSSSNLVSSLDTCDGNSSCIATSLAHSTGGLQNEDLTYTPGIDSTTSFTFGTPFDIHYGLDAFIGYNGSQANSGGPMISNFTMELVSIKVVDGNGATIDGAQIDSQFVDTATAPEPTNLSLLIPILLGGAAAWRKYRKPTIG